MGQSAKNQGSGFFLFSFFFRIDRKKKKTWPLNKDSWSQNVCLFVCFSKSQPWVYSRSPWAPGNILKFRRFQPRYSYKIIYIHILFFIHFLFRTHKQLQSQNGLPHSTLSATPSAVGSQSCFNSLRQLSSLNRRGTTRPRSDTRVDELDLPSLGGHARQKVIL